MATAALAWRLIERDKGIGLQRGRRRARRGADHRLADARRLHDRQAGGRRWLGRADHAPARRDLGGAAGRVHPPRGHGSHTPHPSADLPVAEPDGREHRPAAARGRDVRPLLHGSALHGARARLRPASDRLRVPAGHTRHGNALAALRRAPDHALRGQDDAAARARPDSDRPGVVHPRAGGRQLLREHPAGDARAGRRHRRVVPCPDDACDVGGHAGGRGPRLRPREHDRAGGGRTRPRRSRHPVHHAHRQPPGRRRVQGAGTRRRISPRVLDRCRSGRARLRDRGDGLEAGADRVRGGGPGRGRGPAGAGRTRLRSRLACSQCW